MRPRWQTPIVPLEIHQSDEAIVTGDGRIMRQPMFVFKPEDIERFRSGYACLKCMAVFEKAWPEKCRDCGAPIRRDQAAYFAREYDPHQIHIGPSTTLDYERALMAELIEKERRRNGNGAS